MRDEAEGDPENFTVISQFNFATLKTLTVTEFLLKCLSFSQIVDVQNNRLQHGSCENVFRKLVSLNQ